LVGFFETDLESDHARDGTMKMYRDCHVPLTSSWAPLQMRHWLILVGRLGDHWRQAGWDYLIAGGNKGGTPLSYSIDFHPRNT
jgi:hypothetical protein